MGTTVKVREKYQVTIPEDVRNEIPLTVGERVEVVVRNGEIVIRAMVEVPRGQAWCWDKEWQNQITQSMDLQRHHRVSLHLRQR